jgi:hypothetical protein
VEVTWKAELSNGEIIEEDPCEPASWRWLKEKCKSKGLQIKNLWYNEQLIHDNKKTEAFFVFFEQTSFLKSNISFTKKAIGCITHNGQRVRINWYRNGTSQYLLTEVQEIGKFPIVKDIQIPKG